MKLGDTPTRSLMHVEKAPTQTFFIVVVIVIVGGTILTVSDVWPSQT